MLIQDWMTTNVITTTETTSMMQASRLMKEHHINRLPVLNADNRLIGIVSDRDVKEASPSKATSLDMHEIYYLLSEIKVKDIMTREPLVVRVDDSVEEAALIMLEKHIGGLPVVDWSGSLVGIITDSDIFKVLISITGAAGGIQLAFEISHEKGSLKGVLDALREHNIMIVSVLTSHKDENSRRVYIRVQMRGDNKDASAMIAAVKEKFNLLYWHGRDLP